MNTTSQGNIEKPILIVGAGFSGAVLAREIAEHLDRRVLVIDERSHIAGNCHTERDAATGVMLHKYGPHIFHTDRLDVWKYVNRFAEFGAFTNRIKANTCKGVFSLPINLLTINQFFGKKLSPSEARDFIASLADPTIGEPQNFEEYALKYLGRELYEAFFYGYTKKQWGCEPRELPASILKRLPIRLNYDDNYYNCAYQGIPIDGYTVLVSRILDHPNIEVKLGVRFERGARSEFSRVFYTGPIDAYFDNEFGPLGYRTLDWTRQDAMGDFQGNGIITYTSESIPFTRIHEHKHFAPWETHEKTVAMIEYSRDSGDGDQPFYPKRLPPDLDRLRKYIAAAEQEEYVHFLGRLATYRYLDMHAVIAEALDFATGYIQATVSGENFQRRFSASPLPLEPGTAISTSESNQLI